ncbi:hypothetical protein [Cellvibrio sp. NN19]|uniref:hypothetical protein n=1 Tax=Cellvibrio chitinivorans TaxID=3102792 RepID=UPI002B40A08D|nr:hypothetical protein [Cellvibrio sp. NN19]
MLNQLNSIRSYANEVLIIQLLGTIFKDQITCKEKVDLMSNTMNEILICNGFPEFTPQNRLEFSGFINYLLDVFRRPKISINTIYADDTNVQIQFRIQGIHHEEFMGLMASEGRILLDAQISFRFHNEKISEITMQNIKVNLITQKGLLYELKCH